MGLANKLREWTGSQTKPQTRRHHHVELLLEGRPDHVAANLHLFGNNKMPPMRRIVKMKTLVSHRYTVCMFYCSCYTLNNAHFGQACNASTRFLNKAHYAAVYNVCLCQCSLNEPKPCMFAQAFLLAPSITACPSQYS